jgi:hypothetical protein
MAGGEITLYEQIPKLPRFSTLFKGLARDPKIPSCIY